jgi:hypothetical protein
LAVPVPFWDTLNYQGAHSQTQFALTSAAGRVRVCV